MALLTSDAKFFGLDLSSLGGQFRDAWQQLTQLPWLRRCLPAARMQLIGADGTGQRQMHAAWVRGNSLTLSDAAQGDVSPSAAYAGVLLSPDLVLARTLRLPRLSPQALHSAVALDVQTMSPFSAVQTLWGYALRPDAGSDSAGMQQVDVVITSQDLVAKVLQEQAERLPQGMAPEVWASSLSSPVLLQGFGESRRFGREARQRMWMLLGLAGAIALAIALAVTPTLQLRLRALDASDQFKRLSQASSEVVAKRQAAVDESQSVADLLTRQQQQVDHLRVLALLTELLPDDTAVQRIKFAGNKLTIVGLSDNASDVVSALSKQAGFSEVRLPSAVTRPTRSNKESFTLEAVIDPAVLGLYAAPAATAADADAENKPSDADAPNAPASAKEGA
ncbi:MAG: PilN domain-containing protein [Delftia acidovorans]|uniref:PilN domain-containing protein n=1 Tax=Delftia acidovorans TaxID=80866 RepID=A0A7T2RYU0_DELAC|nr:PilN domain-containing protein [Delftia acidovorans]MBL8355277.1 PilN domain-containing protein [Delftia acidovorans]QPS05886.1 PilN domain-containing protein [Delftia acidovorans]